MNPFEPYFDFNGLLTTRQTTPDAIDYDGGDSLQKQSMYRFGRYHSIVQNQDEYTRECTRVDHDFNMMEVEPGIYVRNPRKDRMWWSDSRCTSRDQLRPMVITLGAYKNKTRLINFIKAQVRRGFFWYQNTHEIDGTKKKWGADIMAPDHLGELIRAMAMCGGWMLAVALVLYPLVILGDIAGLIGMVINMYHWRDPEDADDDNLVLSIMQSTLIFATPFSWFRKMLYKLRPKCGPYGDMTAIEYKHRQSTGAPPFGEMYKKLGY